MRMQYEVTDSAGNVYRRSSANHIYTHAVIVRGKWRDGKPFGRAYWCGRAELAQKEAMRTRGSEMIVEIVEAKRVDRAAMNEEISVTSSGRGPAARWHVSYKGRIASTHSTEADARAGAERFNEMLEQEAKI